MLHSEKLHTFRGEHLAVLNSYDSFFICKAMQNIFASSQKVWSKNIKTFDEVKPRSKPSFSIDILNPG